MSILQRLFGSGASSAKSQPSISFGRYTDAYKPTDLFDQSVALFESGQPMEAYRVFLQYLEDKQEQNISWREEADAIHFDFWQGSQHIYGTANLEKVRVESKVVKAEDLNVGFLRRLMEYNFNLKFSRFSLDTDNCLTIVFDTFTEDGSPLKLLHALRELAIHADKQDDLLLDEFRSLSPAEPRLYGDIPDEEKEVKYQYLCREIEKLFTEMDKGKPDPNQYPSNFAYLLLSLAFRLDYLIKPEGFMMDTLERIRGIYFAKSDRNPQMKLSAARKEFQKLLDRPKEALFREMYRTRSTFGINPAVNHGTIVNMIDGEMPKMDWPVQMQYESLALAVTDYIVGFALFHHTPPKPDCELFHLYVQIREQAFFNALGFDLKFVKPDGSYDSKQISSEIKSIAERNRAAYPNLKPDVSKLEFDSNIKFVKSYLNMIRQLNLTNAQ